MQEVHPFTGTEPTDRKLFEEAKEKSLRNGIRTFEEFSELVDETVEEKSALGFLDGNEDLEQIKDNLKARWIEIEKSIKKSSPSKLIS